MKINWLNVLIILYQLPSQYPDFRPQHKSKTLKAEQTSLIQHFYFINFAELTRGRKKMKNKPFQDQRGYKQLLSSVFLSFFSKDY